MLNPDSITITKEQNDNVTILIQDEKSFNLLSESYLTKMIASVIVRGKGGELLYEFFFTEVKHVIRKDGTDVSITDNDILFNELNQFFFFINNQGGGGGLTNLPVGNFVFVNPLGDDGTGVREDYAFPFLTLNAAKNAAIAGDTILVFGGTYNEANSLQKDGVKWHFIGKPILNLFAASVWNDDAGLTDIQIQGDAIVNHFGSMHVIEISQGSTVNANFHKVTANGFAIFWLGTGSGIINVATKVEVTLVNRCIQFEDQSNYVINIDDIFCNSFVGGVSNAINHRGSNTGTNIINARIIRSERAFGSTITTAPNQTGKTTINISDKISFDQATTIPIQQDSAVAHLSGLLIINGNIDGGKGKAIDIQTQFPTVGALKTLEHNGNAINDGTEPLIYHGADAGFWAAGKSTLKLNGKYTSANDITIENGGVPGNKLTIKGRIENQGTGVATAGVNIQAVGTTIFEDTVIIMDNSAGLRECISAPVPQNVKLFHSVGTNKNASANITNLIAANNLTVDAEYE